MDSNSVDYSPLTHQVAGCHSGTPSNILVNSSGQILKPYKPISNPTFNADKNAQIVTDDPKGDLVPVTLNELEFYALLETSTNQDFVALRKIAPKYFGSRMINGTDHLSLEDFTQGMKYPCVMDLKIGKDRYYPGRSAEKAKQDSIKYPCLQEFGFCIAGIKMSNGSTGEVEYHHMPKVTRKFSSEEVAEHIRKFMHFDEPRGKNLSRRLQEGGEEVLKWSSAQRSILMRGSSLLFVYDAAGLTTEGDDQDVLKARVGTIDFAHVFHSFGKEDTNYISGMKNLVEVLKTGQLPR